MEDNAMTKHRNHKGDRYRFPYSRHLYWHLYHCLCL